MIRALSIAAVAALAACSSSAGTPPSPPPGFDVAYAQPSCAPWDGAAVEFVLRSDSVPAPAPIDSAADHWIRIAIYPANGNDPVGAYAWPATPEQAIASECTAAGCELFPSGTVTVTETHPDSSVAGTISASRADGSRLEGGFQAAWRSRRILCG